MKNIYYSVVIPAHNEAKTLNGLVLEIKKILSKTGKKFEIIIVNDNSTDNTAEVLKDISNSHPELIPINRTTNPGVGYTIRDGFKNVSGKVIITIDADLSHNPLEIPNFLAALKDHDMVCGSRYIKGGKAEVTLTRLIISRSFNFIFRNLIGIHVKDFTSGYRAYKSDIIDNIKLTSKNFGIFIEIPLKAHLAGYKITEIPINYQRREVGKSNLGYFKQGPEYLRVIFEVLMAKLTK